MSKYTDAQKAEYWRKKAQSRSSPRVDKSYVPKKGKHYYAYKQSKINAGFQERREKRELTKDPGVISTVGGVIGGGLGTMLGNPMAGTMIGSKLGHLVEKITGFGDYKIQSNTLMRGGMSQAQIVNSSNKGGVIVRHREYIGDVYATTAFTVTQYPLNPGQAKTFPWLSQGEGKQYEQWRPRGIIMEYVSTSSDAVLSASASSALGSVSMATDYDALDDPFPNKRALLNSEFASSSKPSCGFIHPIECKASQTPTRLLYTRPTLNYPSGGDPRLYDLGNFYVATEGMQNAAANAVVGQLFAIYELEFFKPQISLVDNLTDHWRLSAMTSVALLGTAQSNLAIGGTIGGVINGPGTAYSFPVAVQAGRFMCTYYCYGTAAVITSSVGQITITNGALVDYWEAAAVSSTIMQAPWSGSSTAIAIQFIVDVTAPGCIITFGTVTIPTGAPVGDFWINQISSTITA